MYIQSLYYNEQLTELSRRFNNIAVFDCTSDFNSSDDFFKVRIDVDGLRASLNTPKHCRSTRLSWLGLMNLENHAHCNNMVFYGEPEKGDVSTLSVLKYVLEDFVGLPS